MKSIAFLTLMLISLSIYAQTTDTDANKNSVLQNNFTEKSYFVAIPLAFIVGFGSGHFYAKDTWGGIRYIAYDIAGLGLGFLTLYFDNYSDRSIILAVAIAAVNRIYQAVSAAESVYYYNKNPLLRELDIFETERPQGRFAEITPKANTLKIKLINF
ncbi:MAG: hypothetical protein ACP5QK_10260 [Myxococcota bacterium]